MATCSNGENWKGGSLVPYGDIKLSPAAGVLNYGQGVFEGTKAFHTSKDKIVLFRINSNADRMASSTKRLCIPIMNKEFFMSSVISTVRDNMEFVPPYGKGSLYVRPIVWGTSPALGVQPASEYTFVVFVSPVGSYFKGGVKPLSLKVETDYHRAAPRGIGNAKAIGNYSASLLPLTIAKKHGYDEVIYLDAVDGNRIEELGSANIFICKNDIIKTPKLGRSILAGITRDSILKIAKEKGISVEERKIAISEIMEAHQNGTLKEAFGVGTAVALQTDAETVTSGGSADVDTDQRSCTRHKRQLAASTTIALLALR